MCCPPALWRRFLWRVKWIRAEDTLFERPPSVDKCFWKWQTDRQRIKSTLFLSAPVKCDDRHTHTHIQLLKDLRKLNDRLVVRVWSSAILCSVSLFCAYLFLILGCYNKHLLPGFCNIQSSDYHHRWPSEACIASSYEIVTKKDFTKRNTQTHTESCKMSNNVSNDTIPEEPTTPEPEPPVDENAEEKVREGCYSGMDNKYTDRWPTRPTRPSLTPW